MRSSTIQDAADEAAARELTLRATDQAQLDQLRERLAPVVDHAIRLARAQGAQAALAAGQARLWASPRVGAAVERGRAAAAPHALAAAQRFAPAVDAARDRIVDDLLPRLADAVHHATVAGAAATSTAAETVSRTVEEAARALAEATPSARAKVARRRRRARAVWLALFSLLAGAAGAAAWKQAKSHRAAAWEVPPATGLASSSRTGTTEYPSPAADSVADVIAAAAGPNDAGIADPAATTSTPTPSVAGSEDGPTVDLPDEPVDPVAPLSSAPATGVDAEPAAPGTPRGTGD